MGSKADVCEVKNGNAHSSQLTSPVICIMADENDLPETEPQKLPVAEVEESNPLERPDWDAADDLLLARIAMAEAEGEDTEGKALVMLVVLNRVWSDEFPDNIEDVITENNGTTYQFGPVAPGGRWWTVEPDQDCWDALNLIESGWNGSNGALYFESKSDSDWHRRNLEFLFQHGRHYFYTEKVQE